MSEEAIRQGRAELIGGFICLGIALAILGFANTYTGTAGLFPRLVSAFAVALCLLDIAVSFLAYRRTGRDEHGLVAAFTNARPHLQAVSWLALFVAAIWVLGFHIGIVLSAVLFVTVKGRSSIVQGSLFAVCLWIVLYLVFEIALGVRMYPGLVIGPLL